MIDHADTIRLKEWVEMELADGYDYCCEVAKSDGGLTYEMLRSLLAERQQAIDALREIEKSAICTDDANTIARAALLNLGEQKVWRCDHCEQSPEWPDGQELRPMGIGSPRCPNCYWKLRLVNLGEQP